MSIDNNITISRLRTRLASVLMMSLATATLCGQEPASRPTLVVGITVQGLNEDYLELLRHRFGNDGFKRLLDNSVVIDNVEWGNGIDATAATAMLMTGTSPSVSGIAGEKDYDPSTRHAVPTLHDAAVIGNFTNETYSPSGLLVSTLGDEVRINDSGVGHVYSFSADPQRAIILAGHAGNGAYWINDTDGKWSTTTYYRDMPTAVSRRNYTNPLSSRLDTMVWRPSLKLDQYPDLPDHKKLYPFNHRFSRNDAGRYRAFKESALANTEITSIAAECIDNMKLGKREVMDMISVDYNLVPYRYTRDADNRIETQDAYIKLDANLARLFQAIERGPGMNNTLVIVAGTPAPANGKRDDEKWRIPHGEFSVRKAMSLLNMYLIAIHGNGEWVNGYHNGHFYLNHKLIKERDIDLSTIRRESADFMGRMSGVSRVYTIEDIIERRTDEADRSLRRNTVLAKAGDIIVNVTPGWEITEVDSDPDITTGKVQRLGTESSQVFIMAPGVKPRHIETPLDPCVVTPTVARLLRIRSPNAAAMSPLRLR